MSIVFLYYRIVTTFAAFRLVPHPGHDAVSLEDKRNELMNMASVGTREVHEPQKTLLGKGMVPCRLTPESSAPRPGAGCPSLAEVAGWHDALQTSGEDHGPAVKECSEKSA